jgi:hypothetical protein
MWTLRRKRAWFFPNKRPANTWTWRTAIEAAPNIPWDQIIEAPILSLLLAICRHDFLPKEDSTESSSLVNSRPEQLILSMDMIDRAVLGELNRTDLESWVNVRRKSRANEDRETRTLILATGASDTLRTKKFSPYLARERRRLHRGCAWLTLGLT